MRRHHKSSYLLAAILNFKSSLVNFDHRNKWMNAFFILYNHVYIYNHVVWVSIDSWYRKKSCQPTSMATILDSRLIVNSNHWNNVRNEFYIPRNIEKEVLNAYVEGLDEQLGFPLFAWRSLAAILIIQKAPRWISGQQSLKW